MTVVQSQPHITLMNTCILSGRVGKDPRVNTAGEYLVANFSLAVNHSFKKDEDGNYLTTWFSLQAWGKTAEFVEKHVKKGCKILVNGEILKPDSYDTEYGTRINCNIRVNNLEMLTWPDEKKEEKDEVPF